MSFSFQMKFAISDVPYQLIISSAVEVEEEWILGRQVITLMSGERGVNMIRTEDLDGNSEFSLTGQGLMENQGEEELMNFATMCMMQEGPMRVMEITFDLPDGGIYLGEEPGQIHASEQFVELLEHFLGDLDVED